LQKTLIRLLDEPAVLVLTRQKRKNTSNVSFTTDVKHFYSAVDTVFFCVPISALEQTVKAHAPFVTTRHVLIDVLSVKLHAKDVFDTYIPDMQTQIILTHPMFGPDSSRAGFAGLPIMMDRYRASHETFARWKERFAASGLEVLVMSADAHDKLAARSQGVAHFMGRLLEEYGFTQTKIDTLGARKLKEIMDQVCNDSWQLYFDLQQFNPYTKREIENLKAHFDTLYKKTHS
jgi:prephenate dehydrogenase